MTVSRLTSKIKQVINLSYMNASLISLQILFPLLSATFVCILGFFIFLRDKDNTANRLFGLVSVVFTMWLFGTFMMFIADIRGDDVMAIFWDRFIYLGVVFMPALEYHFSLNFTKRKPNKMLYVAYALSVFFLIASRTDYFVYSLFKYRWGAHTIAGILHHFFLGFFFFYVFALLSVFYKYVRTLHNRIEKNKIIIALIAFAILNLVGGIGYLPAYKISVFPIFLIAPAIFVMLIGYAIVKYKFLKIKTFATQVFIFFIVSISLINIFLSASTRETVLRVVFFVAITLFSYLLVKNMKVEIERKEELEIANAKLKQLDRVKSEFISIASHQLRTPLTAIKGFTTLILEEAYGKINKQLRETVGDIYENNQQLIILVDDLLNVSKIESGKINLNFEKIDIGEVCQKIANTFAFKAEEKKLNFRFKKPNKFLPKVVVDKKTITEAISNVIDNALKYTVKGRVSMEIFNNTDNIRITISDTGIGIAKKQIFYLFSKFSRGTNAKKMDISGTGLGLYVAKSMVKINGGHIWAESDGEDKGSKFIIEIPAQLN